MSLTFHVLQILLVGGLADGTVEVGFAGHLFGDVLAFQVDVRVIVLHLLLHLLVPLLLDGCRVLPRKLLVFLGDTGTHAMGHIGIQMIKVK